jgi:Na+-transporting methylmalonyl-CoA/oxaloacetate decarboxylase gamma subunit
MMDDKPPSQKSSGGTTLLVLLILAAIMAGLAAWASLRNPSGVPQPSSTAAPTTVPEGEVGQ